MGRKKKSGTNLFSIIIVLIIVGFIGVKNINDSTTNIQPQNISESETNEDGNIHQAEISDDSYEIPSFNSKQGGQIIKHKGYTLSYNADYKTSQWVGWQLTKSKVMGQEKRTDKFIPDPDVRGAKAYTSDYTNSGYDRGHMAPAADMKWDKTAMMESFYLSNICPQNKNLNRGDWNDLEELSRTLAKRHNKIYITCGPIYDNKFPKRIGNNKVAVPDAFYKVIFINDKKEPKAYGFIFNNKAGSKPLKSYIVTVDSIENRTGIDFMPTLDKKIQDKIEAEVHHCEPK